MATLDDIIKRVRQSRDIREMNEIRKNFHVVSDIFVKNAVALSVNNVSLTNK